MIKSKKGALELSVNTIVVIVIGVTLLTLGLVFVRGILTQTTDLSEQAFEDANRQLDSLGSNVNDFISLAPETIRIKAGDTSGFSVLIKNIESNTYSGVTANVVSYDEKVTCEFLDGSESRDLRNLIPGAEERFNIRIKTEKSSIGDFGCKFSLSGGGIEQGTSSTTREVSIIVS